MRINEKDIIPTLKEAREQCTETIVSSMDVKAIGQAEKLEAALIQAMDIIYDYQNMADEHNRMMEKYEREVPVIKRGMDFYQCPACGKRTSRNHTHCHWCGKKLGWGR